jgi:predicted small secreted protein
MICLNRTDLRVLTWFLGEKPQVVSCAFFNTEQQTRPDVVNTVSKIQSNLKIKDQEKIMSTFWKRVFALAIIAGFGMGLAACETADGFGKDVEKLGDNIQDTAN